MCGEQLKLPSLAGYISDYAAGIGIYDIYVTRKVGIMRGLNIVKAYVNVV